MAAQKGLIDKSRTSKIPEVVVHLIQTPELREQLAAAHTKAISQSRCRKVGLLDLNALLTEVKHRVHTQVGVNTARKHHLGVVKIKAVLGVVGGFGTAAVIVLARDSFSDSRNLQMVQFGIFHAVVDIRKIHDHRDIGHVL